MNARYYEPKAGRFLTPDTYTGSPYNPNTQNVYTYTGNNPVNYVDPTGHWGEAIQAFDAGIVWGAANSMSMGALSGMIDNNIVGSNTLEFRLGMVVVDLLVLELGFGLMKGGEALGIAGVATTPQGYGVLVLGAGAGLAAAGLVFTYAGARSIISDISYLASNAGDMPSAGGGYTGVNEQHHLLPQQFKEQFENAGLNIEDYTMPMDKAVHRLKPHGIHTGVDNWNRQWADFFKDYPNPNADQILDQLDKMLKEFGLELE